MKCKISSRKLHVHLATMSFWNSCLVPQACHKDPGQRILKLVKEMGLMDWWKMAITWRWKVLDLSIIMGPMYQHCKALKIFLSLTIWFIYFSLDFEGDQSNKSAKSELFEICAGNCWSPPLFVCCKEEGPCHLRM